MLPTETYKRMQRGYNLMELMVVLFVGSILMSVGVPAFNDFMDNGRMAAATNDFTTAIHMARTEAIKRKAVVVMCPTLTWNNAVPQCSYSAAVGFDSGWLVFVDSDAIATSNMQPENADAIIQAHPPLNDDIEITLASRTGNVIGASRKFIMYDSDGFPENGFVWNPAAFHVQLCDDRGDKNTGGGIAAGRWIQITTTGRPQIHRTQEVIESADNPADGCAA